VSKKPRDFSDSELKEIHDKAIKHVEDNSPSDADLMKEIDKMNETAQKRY
jgi:hypothetical protein